MMLATMRSSMRGMMMTLNDQTSGRRVVIGISRPLSSVVTGTTVKITTVMDQTGEVVVKITAAATTTTLATTTGIPIMDVTREAGVISPTDLPILVHNSPGVPLRATLTQFALLVDIILALQARTLLSHGCEGFLSIIHDTTSEVPSIHDQPIVSEFPDVFPDELPGKPPVREVEFNIELIPGSEPISKTHYRMAPIELKELKDQLQELLERGFIRPTLQARTLLYHGCEGFLATIHDTTSEIPSIYDQPIVSEFPDVFLDELPGIPPVHEVEFNIELIPGAEPISKAPYRMAPVELKELKD
nr:putative reverse transcriptase domain, aspartic peptidase domain protein [Tanacetum cinerariifolium]